MFKRKTVTLPECQCALRRRQCVVLNKVNIYLSRPSHIKQFLVWPVATLLIQELATLILRNVSFPCLDPSSCCKHPMHRSTRTDKQTHTHIHARQSEERGREACAPPCPQPELNTSPTVRRRPTCLGSDQNLRGPDVPAVTEGWG